MALIQYTDFIQSGTVSDSTASGTQTVSFSSSFSDIPTHISLSYASGESGTLSYSSASTADFILHTSVAGTVSWAALYSSI